MVINRRAASLCFSLVALSVPAIAVGPTNSARASVQWVETAKLTASNAAAYNGFGDWVAISGNTAIVGAPGNDTGVRSGSAYLFDVTTGQELHRLNASDAAAGDELGYSVGIDGNTAIVGAVADDNLTGSAYLFNATTGTQTFKLTASDGGGKVGSSVGISGNTAIVGGTWSGGAYLFDVTTGNELRKLTASDAAAYDLFGNAVAISGNTAIVGAWRQGAGAAYLFDATTGQQLHKLTAPDGAITESFGWSVGIDGNTAIVGAQKPNSGGSKYGAAYLFDVTTGNELFKLSASDAAAYDHFGYSVDIDGNTAIVGASRHDGAGDSSGSAYLFDVATGSELQKLTASDAAAGDRFGSSVGISDNTVIVGAAYSDAVGNDSGSAYLFMPTSGGTGPGGGPGPNVVPEPTAIVIWFVLAALGITVGWCCRRKAA